VHGGDGACGGLAEHGLAVARRTVYGSAIEEYIEHYKGSGKAKARGFAGGVFSEKLGQVVYGGNPFTLLNLQFPDLLNPGNAKTSREEKRREVEQAFIHAKRDNLSRFLNGLQEDGVNIEPLKQALNGDRAKELFSADRSQLAKNMNVKVDELEKIIRQIQKSLSSTGKNSDGGEDIFASAVKYAYDLSSKQHSSTRQYLDSTDLTKLLLGKEVAHSEAVVSQALFGDNWKSLSRENKEAVLLAKKKGAFALRSKNTVHDLDHTIADALGALTDLPSDLQGASSEEISDFVIKETMLHEFGHMIGFAHNFKENVMPRKGTVPTKYYGADT
jgi:DNA-binding transcriptional MerR regulator